MHLLAGVLKEIRLLTDEETCTYLHACISTKTHGVNAPTVPMYLDSLLADAPLTGGFAPKLGDYHVQVLSVGGFPNTSTPGILDILNRLDFEYRWVTRFIFLDKTDAEKQLRGYWQRWLSARQSFVALMREAITGQVPRFRTPMRSIVRRMPMRRCRSSAAISLPTAISRSRSCCWIRT